MNKTIHPIITVGILKAKSISIELKGEYTISGDENTVTGKISFSNESGFIVNHSKKHTGQKEIELLPVDNENNTVKIYNVIIGVDFHWERKEDQIFKGGLVIKPTDDGNIYAINTIHVEEYLKSVISSEMNPDVPYEFLKAHAIVSRSWLFAQIYKTAHSSPYTPESKQKNTTKEYIKWYDRDDHTLFDVCADDHCQRYQGVTKQNNSTVIKAINETFGQVLIHNGEICDARFSKCCGGKSEAFENVWQPVPLKYLSSISDSEQEIPTDLQTETGFKNYLDSYTGAFCNTTSKEILSTILPDFDQETPDFFRWQIFYTQEEVTAFFKDKTNFELGEIIDLIPVERGFSGRITRLKVIGSKNTVIIGKELEIRRLLSNSHLKSSAFIVEKEKKGEDTPSGFLLKGAGWGHGVGMCQIGGAVMANKGYSCNKILEHYFLNIKIQYIYGEN